jgi:uncharacterized protein (DUF2062 family)
MSYPKSTKKILSPVSWRQEFQRQLKELRGRPHELSLGVAIGVFIGITPTIPFHMLLAIALAAVMRASKLAAALGVWVGNPLTLPIFYYGSYQLGRRLLDLPDLHLPPDYSVLSIMRLSGHLTVAMLYGGMLLGIFPALLAYVLTYKFTKSPRFQGNSHGAMRGE